MRSTKSHIWYALSWVLWLSLLMLLASCQMRESGSSTGDSKKISEMNKSYFSIHYFADKNPAIPVDFDPQSENGWKDLLDIDLSQSDFVTNEDDIKYYDWSSQKITLESDVGKYFVPSQTEPFGFSFFVIELDSTPIIGGGILPWSSAVRLDLPILYVPDPLHSEPFELYLRSRTGITKPTPSFPIVDQSVASEIRQRFLEMGKLVE